ncbi:hypothetical protein BC629DRAFT_1440226 [Irpex lacteus]|nr:hypothetical protein BC629DRAFT_1440226 [Irpex lacteus]
MSLPSTSTKNSLAHILSSDRFLYPFLFLHVSAYPSLGISASVSLARRIYALTLAVPQHLSSGLSSQSGSRRLQCRGGRKDWSGKWLKQRGHQTWCDMTGTCDRHHLYSRGAIECSILAADDVAFEFAFAFAFLPMLCPIPHLVGPRTPLTQDSGLRTIGRRRAHLDQPPFPVSRMIPDDVKLDYEINNELSLVSIVTTYSTARYHSHSGLSYSTLSPTLVTTFVPNPTSSPLVTQLMIGGVSQRTTWRSPPITHQALESSVVTSLASSPTTRCGFSNMPIPRPPVPFGTR